MVEIKAKGRKSRTAGRFGVRYGTKNRKLVADIEEKMRAEYTCSKCGAKKIKRIGFTQPPAMIAAGPALASAAPP